MPPPDVFPPEIRANSATRSGAITNLHRFAAQTGPAKSTPTRGAACTQDPGTRTPRSSTCSPLAGATAALVYCLHCTEMEAPFIGLWYVIGMLIPAVVGALLGRALLRW